VVRYSPDASRAALQALAATAHVGDENRDTFQKSSRGIDSYRGSFRQLYAKLISVRELTSGQSPKPRARDLRRGGLGRRERSRSIYSRQ
jgi:hypothetical protein